MVIGLGALLRGGMFYMSSKRGLVIAAASALVLGTLLSLGAVFGLNRYLEPDEQTTGSAIFARRP